MVVSEGLWSGVGWNPTSSSEGSSSELRLGLSRRPPVEVALRPISRVADSAREPLTPVYALVASRGSGMNIIVREGLPHHQTTTINAVPVLARRRRLHRLQRTDVGRCAEHGEPHLLRVVGPFDPIPAPGDRFRNHGALRPQARILPHGQRVGQQNLSSSSKSASKDPSVCIFALGRCSAQRLPEKCPITGVFSIVFSRVHDAVCMSIRPKDNMYGDT